MSLYNTIEKKIIRFINILKEHPLSIFSIYLVTFFVYRDFGIRMFYGYLFLGFILILLFMEKIITERKMYIQSSKIPYLILSLIILIFFIRPSSLKDKDNIVYILLMLITLGYVVITKESKKDIKIAFSIIYVAATVFSVFILFFQVFKKQYWQLIYPILSPTAKFYAKHYFFKGYSVSLGGVTYSLYIIIFGYFTTLTHLLYFDLNRNRKIISIASLCLFTVVILISGRRGELLSFILTLIFIYLISATDKIRVARIKRLGTLIIISLVVIILSWPLLSKVKVLQRHTSTINAVLGKEEIHGGISSGRIDLYGQAWEFFKNKPILGIGTGQFANQTAAIMQSAEGKGMDVHNVVLQMLAETGLVGFLCISGSYLFIYYKTIKDTLNIWKQNSFKEKPYIIFSNTLSLMIQTFLIITSMLDPINYKIIFWVIFYIGFYLFVYSHEKINESSNNITIQIGNYIFI